MSPIFGEILSKLGAAVFIAILDRITAWIQADKIAQQASENAALIAVQASVVAAAKLKEDEANAQAYIAKKRQEEIAEQERIKAQNGISADVLGRWYY